MCFKLRKLPLLFALNAHGILTLLGEDYRRFSRSFHRRGFPSYVHSRDILADLFQRHAHMLPASESNTFSWHGLLKYMCINR